MKVCAETDVTSITSLSMRIRKLPVNFGCGIGGDALTLFGQSQANKPAMQLPQEMPP